MNYVPELHRDTHAILHPPPSRVLEGERGSVESMIDMDSTKFVIGCTYIFVHEDLYDCPITAHTTFAAFGKPLSTLTSHQLDVRI